MAVEFDGEKFRQAVKLKRGSLGLSLRAMSDLTGVHFATLSRCENGTLPDLNTFALICEWLGEPMLAFHKKTKK